MSALTAVPMRTCHCCNGVGEVPDMPPGRRAALEAAAWQVPAARRVLNSGPPGNPLYVEALRLRVEHPDTPVAHLAGLTGDGVSVEGFRKRLARALGGAK